MTEIGTTLAEKPGIEPGATTFLENVPSAVRMTSRRRWRRPKSQVPSSLI